MIGILLLIIVLTLVNGFFAAAEMALVSVTPSQLHRLEKQQVKHAHTLANIKQDSTKYLSTIQVAITFAGFLSSAFAGSSLSGHVISWLQTFNITLSEQVTIIIITILLSYFTLVFGELVPKRIALASSQKFALFCAPIVKIVMIVFKPFVALLSISTSFVLKIIGLKQDKNQEQITENDIKEMIVYGHIKGLYTSDETKMLERIFQLDDITVGMIMTPIEDTIALDINEISKEKLDSLIASKFSRIPFYSKNMNHVEGILLTKDILINFKDKPITKKDISSSLIKPIFFHEDEKINIILSQMKKATIHMAFVIDDENNTIGIVTMEDVIEEIVGNIYDEHDDPYQRLRLKHASTYIINDEMTIGDLEQTLNISFVNIKNKDISVTKYVSNQLKKLSKSEQVVTSIGYFEILKIKKNKIQSLRFVYQANKKDFRKS